MRWENSVKALAVYADQHRKLVYVNADFCGLYGKEKPLTQLVFDQELGTLLYCKVGLSFGNPSYNRAQLYQPQKQSMCGVSVHEATMTQPPAQPSDGSFHLSMVGALSVPTQPSAGVVGAQEFTTAQSTTQTQRVVYRQR